MQTSQSIVAIASDDALLRSLAFALGVEGYAVQPCGSWQAARDLIPLSACVIVDVDICRKDSDARKALLEPDNRILMLTDGMPQPDVAATIRLIPKPLDGSDIVEGVRHFHRART